MQNLVSIIKRLWIEKPLPLILFLAFLIRLISVIFSKGYGMHDDHFLIIEASKSWVDGFDYNSWLPKEGIADQKPSGHSFFYVGLHYMLFLFLKMIHLIDPQHQMYVVRFLHAILSLVVVHSAYKITFKLAGAKHAKIVGLLIAVYWFMPFLSVRNLIEVACIPPLILATWLVIKNSERQKIAPYIYAGILLGIAFSVRFQCILFAGGFVLALLILKRIKEAVVCGFLFLLVATGVQGTIDMAIWGKPFVEFTEYVRYNIEFATSYHNQPWYLYFILMSGILIPPISLFLLFGFFRNWRKNLLLFLPSFIFLAFHSYFPNKQERFILPIIPFIITLGYIGWTEFVENSKYWDKHKVLLKRCWTFFWILNLIALPVVSGAYTKRNRVESMYYLSKKSDVNRIAIENSNQNRYLLFPKFYLENWNYIDDMVVPSPASEFYETYSELPDEERPNYILFLQEKNIETRVADVKKHFPGLTYEATIEPSYIDKLVHWLNPINNNETTFIYKIEPVAIQN